MFKPSDIPIIENDTLPPNVFMLIGASNRSNGAGRLDVTIVEDGRISSYRDVDVSAVIEKAIQRVFSSTQHKGVPQSTRKRTPSLRGK